MKLNATQKKVLSPKIFRNAILAILGACTIDTLSAAPIINDFSSIANLTPYANSVSFENNSGSGPLEVTVEGSGIFGGKGIFTWSQWLSLDKIDEQYFFSLAGADSIGTTPATIVDVAFVVGGVGTISTGPITLTGGSWSFDVYQAVSQQYYAGGPLAPGLFYQVEFYIGPISGNDGTGIVYELDSFSATAVPEPTTALLMGIGLTFMCLKGRKRNTFR